VADLWDDLLSCLKLRELVQEDAADDMIFEGENLHLSYHRLFGGQLLAQFVTAASLTSPGKAVKSLHALFPREGLPEEPVRYEVTRHHEGGTFATLSVVARQSKGVIATASVSMHTVEGGRSLQAVAPVSHAPETEHRVELGLIPWETRSPISLDSPEVAAAEYSLWMRTPPTGPELAFPLAAYATDLTLIGTALRPIDGVSQHDARKAFASAVTSHTMWFHRPFRTDDWLLLRQHSPIMAHSRCFGRGDVLTADGTLVASYAQEALLRFRDLRLGQPTAIIAAFLPGHPCRPR
jgi:acyl-CoA thioesterase-2